MGSSGQPAGERIVLESAEQSYLVDALMAGDPALDPADAEALFGWALECRFRDAVLELARDGLVAVRRVRGEWEFRLRDPDTIYRPTLELERPKIAAQAE